MSTADDFLDGGSEARYHVIFLSPVPGRTLTPEIVSLHAAHLAELDEDGRLVLAGPVPERAVGLVVLRTATAAEARTIAEEDPLVLGGYQSYEIGTWLMSNRENGYRPNIKPEFQK
jgi:uncharacterized protein YciI